MCCGEESIQIQSIGVRSFSAARRDHCRPGVARESLGVVHPCPRASLGRKMLGTAALEGPVFSNPMLRMAEMSLSEIMETVEVPRC